MMAEATVLDLGEVRQTMIAAAAVARLPLRAGRWGGLSGSVLGLGTGSSLDFQDQRAYAPGDDPRHINWQAYARTGSYTMKLYRQEVSPRVDILIDQSPSMFVNAAKARRSWELLYWCVESALRWGASPRVLRVSGSRTSEVSMDQVLAGRCEAISTATEANVMPMLQRSPVRQGSLRVLVSDLLYPGNPMSLTAPLVQSQGRGIILAPFDEQEASPDWQGNIDFEDCESQRKEKRRVDAATLERYKQAYTRHFGLWREPCLKAGIAFARVPAEGDFLSALRSEGLQAGVAEWF